MTVHNINMEDTTKRVAALIAEEKFFSPALIKNSLEVLLLLARHPGQPFWTKPTEQQHTAYVRSFSQKETENRWGTKTGGRYGRFGKILQQVSDPDIVKPNLIKRSLLPPGEYRNAGHETR